jgi:hypothetical protein
MIELFLKTKVIKLAYMMCHQRVKRRSLVEQWLLQQY